MFVTWRDKKICTCPCHKEGVEMMHMVACCNLTYEKYINKENKISEKKLIEIFEKIEK